MPGLGADSMHAAAAANTTGCGNSTALHHGSSTESGSTGSISREGGIESASENTGPVDAAAATGQGPGVPVLLYTGVVRRPDAPIGLRPSSLAVSELCYEQQLAAVAADPGTALC
jgi:hypothetical protein